MRVVIVEAIYTLVILEPGLRFLGRKRRRKRGERKNHLQLLSMILLLMMRL